MIENNTPFTAPSSSQGKSLCVNGQREEHKRLYNMPKVTEALCFGVNTIR